MMALRAMTRARHIATSSSLLMTSHVRSFQTDHIFASSIKDKAICEIITDSNDPRMKEIYRLRFKVGRQVMKLSRSDPRVYQDDEDGYYEVRDDLDEEESTVSFLIRNPNDGKPIASIRTVCGVQSQLEMEKFGWFDVPQSIKDGGLVEWCRLCAVKEARGTNAAPMLYLQSVRYHREMKNDNFMFMVDQRATKLIKYYNDWTIAEQLTKEPVSCDEFEVGRKSHVFHMPMGAPLSLARLNFDLRVYYPGVVGISAMRSYKTIRASTEEFERGTALNEGGITRGSRAFSKKDHEDLPNDIEMLKKMVVTLRGELKTVNEKSNKM